MVHNNVTRTKTFMMSDQAAHITLCVPLLEVACVHVSDMCIKYS